MSAKELRHYLTFADCTREEYDHLFERTRWIKERFKRYEAYQPLRDRTLAMVFEKASTRTRVSFEAGMSQLGGIAINLSRGDTQLSRGEPIEDLARVISRMVDIVMIRTFEQSIIERFAAYSRVPVINGLTNEHHPCQILADVFTFIEHRGPIAGHTVAWIGDANNMLTSWLQAARILGFKMNVSTPPGYGVDPAAAGQLSARHFEHFDDPRQAVRGASLVTTDVWTSMGFEEENEKRKRDFAAWQVDAAMMRAARADALFMHCLPAHRGEEVTHEVIEGPQSVVWDEAENRMHAQKALLEYLVCGRAGTP
jgi:ornithine carbamoyltransferase